MLSWDTLENRRSDAKSVLMYKILNDHTAPGLRWSFVRREIDQTNYHLRNTATELTIPKPKREFLKKVLNIAALWQLRYIDIFDKYRYFKNIDIRYSIFRTPKISKVIIGQFNYLFFGYYIPVKFKKHVYYRKRMGNLKVQTKLSENFACKVCRYLRSKRNENSFPYMLQYCRRYLAIPTSIVLQIDF